MPTGSLKEEKKKTNKINFLKTSSLSDDKILSSKKIFFFKQSHCKQLILNYVSLIHYNKKQLNNTPSTMLLAAFWVQKL
jgi:hypothetical protein